jgi:multimeric flavodoxin WrbA
MAVDDVAAQLLIVWHSRTGASRAMAQAAAKGAMAAGGCRLIEAVQARPEHLLAASCYLFCCPENLATVTGEMKAFFDRCYYPLLGQIEGRAYATMIAAGSDGAGATRQIDRIVSGWRLRRVTEPMIACTQAQTPEEILSEKTLSSEVLQECHNLGQTLATGLALGVF